MAEKLSITIFLDGAAEIERQLEGIGQAGTKAFEEIGKAAEGVGGFDKLDPKDVTAKLEKFGVKGKAAIEKITTAVAQAGRLERIVRGVADVEQGFAKLSVAASAMSTRVTTAVTAVGTAMSAAVGPITRVARSFGLIGRLGVGGAVVGLGAAVVGMEKAADAARVLEGNLQAVFRNAATGTAFFNQIQNAARTAGTSLESTGKVILDIFRTLQSGLKAKGIIFAPGEGFKQTRDEAVLFFDTLQKGMQLSGTRAADTEKAIAALNKELQTTGVLSGATLRKLAADFPQLANELVKFLGVPGQTMEQLADQVDRGIRKIDINKFRNAVNQITPDIQKLRAAFDPTLAQRMDTISGAWDRLINSFGKSPAGAGIKAVMDDIAKGLDEFAKKQEQIGKFTVDKPPATVTGGLSQQMFDEFNQNTEIAKQNWERLKNLVSQPLELALSVANLTPVGLAINTVLRLIEKLRAQSQDKITVPFEADAEPAWVQAYLGFIEKVKTAFKSMFTPDVAAADASEPLWVQKYLDMIAKVKAAFLSMFTQQPAAGGQLSDQGALTPQRFTGGGAGPQGVGSELLPDSPESQNIDDRRIAEINTALAALATAAQEATTALQSLSGLDFSNVGTAVDSLNTAISSVTDSVQGLSFSDMTQAFADATAAAQQLGTDLQNLGLSEVAGAMQQVVSAANSAAQALSSIQAQGGGNFARGGLLGGRGTGTSDSNLAWVSRGEHIMPARAVRQPGVLAFLEALRRSGGSLRDVLDDMGRFALGGLVPRTLPAFAAGGLADMRGGGRPIALTINAGGGDRQTFQVWADADVAEKVVRYAVSRQAASAGRKSGAFG